MPRFALVLALALAAISSVACTASSEPDAQGDGEEVTKSEDPLANTTPTGTLTCNRWKGDHCITLGNWCNRQGRDLKCDLQGNCTCAPAAVFSPY